MFIVSGPELVIAQCKAGIVGRLQRGRSARGELGCRLDHRAGPAVGTTVGAADR